MLCRNESVPGWDINDAGWGNVITIQRFPNFDEYHIEFHVQQDFKNSKFDHKLAAQAVCAYVLA